MPGNDSIYTLTNKATQKQLSFSAKLNGADKFGTAIAAGISEFKIKHGTVVIVLSVQLLMASWLRCLKLPAC